MSGAVGLLEQQPHNLYDQNNNYTNVECVWLIAGVQPHLAESDWLDSGLGGAAHLGCRATTAPRINHNKWICIQARWNPFHVRGAEGYDRRLSTGGDCRAIVTHPGPTTDGGGGDIASAPPEGEAMWVAPQPPPFPRYCLYPTFIAPKRYQRYRKNMSELWSKCISIWLHSTLLLWPTWESWFCGPCGGWGSGSSFWRLGEPPLLPGWSLGCQLGLCSRLWSSPPRRHI